MSRLFRLHFKSKSKTQELQSAPMLTHRDWLSQLSRLGAGDVGASARWVPLPADAMAARSMTGAPDGGSAGRKHKQHQSSNGCCSQELCWLQRYCSLAQMHRMLRAHQHFWQQGGQGNRRRSPTSVGDQQPRQIPAWTDRTPVAPADSRSAKTASLMALQRPTSPPVSSTKLSGACMMARDHPVATPAGLADGAALSAG